MMLVSSYKTIIPVYKIELSENIGTLYQEATNALQPVFKVTNSHPTSPPSLGSMSWNTPNIALPTN